MSVHAGPNTIKSGLVLHLDASNPKSYPGTGTSWFDLSGNGYDFNISASAFSKINNIKHMNFDGSAGCAKRVINNTLTDLPSFNNATIIAFSTIISTSNERTLIRGATTDHQIYTQVSSNILGMYSRDDFQVGPQLCGFDITTLPSYTTQFNFLCWRLSMSSPYYQFQFNDNPALYLITNINARFNNGFCCIGAFHNNSTIVTSSNQYWGRVACFLYYNRHLSMAEINQNYVAIRGRFGL